MPRLIVIDGHEGQRRQIQEALAELERAGWPLTGKFEAGGDLPDWRALFERSMSRGLFADREAIVVESAELLGPFPDELATHIEGEGAACVVIAASSPGKTSSDTKKKASAKEEEDEGDAVPKAQKRGGVKGSFSKAVVDMGLVTFLKGEAAVPPWKRKDWLLALAREKGLSLAPDAAALLGESIESQEELRSELEKLGTWADGREIRASDVRALSFDEGARAQLTFLDGVCQARPRDVARSLRHLRLAPLLPILTALCNRLRPALYMASFPKAKDQAMRAIGMGQGKDYALRMAQGALSAFGPAAVRTFMLAALRLSYLEKGPRAEGWPGFELIVWELMSNAKGGDIARERPGRGWGAKKGASQR